MTATVFGLTPAVRLARQLARVAPNGAPGLSVEPGVVIDTPALAYLIKGEAKATNPLAMREDLAAELWRYSTEAIAPDMEKAVVLRELPDGRTARTGVMDRWECAAFAEWLKKSIA